MDTTMNTVIFLESENISYKKMTERTTTKSLCGPTALSHTPLKDLIVGLFNFENVISTYY